MTLPHQVPPHGWFFRRARYRYPPFQPLRLGPLIPNKTSEYCQFWIGTKFIKKLTRHFLWSFYILEMLARKKTQLVSLKSRSCPMSNGFYFCPHNLLKCRELFYCRRVCSRKFHVPVSLSKASFPFQLFLERFPFCMHPSMYSGSLLIGVTDTWKNCPMWKIHLYLAI